MFSLYARVTILWLCAQHENELPQKRLLRCTWDLSDQWRCYRGGRGGQCPPCCSTIWSTVCLWGWNTCRLCSCRGGRVRLAELSAAPRGCLAARGAQGCGVEGSSAARWLLWVTGVSLWPVTGINKNIVKAVGCLLAPGTASTKNSAMPSSYTALFTKRLLMGESVLISSVLQKWQLSNEEISTKAKHWICLPHCALGHNRVLEGWGGPRNFGSMCSTASVISRHECSSASNRDVKVVKKLF